MELLHRTARPRLASLAAAAWLALCAGALAAEDEACAPRLASVDAAGVGTFVAECRWRIAPRHVAAIVGDSQRIAAVSTSLAESTRLADGRIVNVHAPGWPVADRQSTLAIDKQPLPDGGLLLSYAMAPSQAPLGAGRIQARRDEGRWEIRDDGSGGTWLRYESRYDPGGNLPLSVVRRTVGGSIGESLAEILAAARAEEKSAKARR
jgi:hypothetical protein